MAKVFFNRNWTQISPLFTETKWLNPSLEHSRKFFLALLTKAEDAL